MLQVPSAETVRQTLLANPELLQRVQSMFPQLAQAVRSPSAFEQAWLSINPASFFTSASLNNSSMQFSSEVADEDLMAVAVQQRIEEQIRQDAIAENMQTALENHPETFTQVPMLYVPVEVNGQPVKAFVDSGAQATIASSDCIRRCNLTHLIDKRFSGVARGVGTAKIVGVIHSAPLKIGKLFLPCKFTVLEQQDVDLLLGLDMLRRYQACIDLNENVLCFHSERIPFLPESEIPKAKPIVSSGIDVQTPNNASNSLDLGSAVPTNSVPGTSKPSAPSQSILAKLDQLVAMGFDRGEAAQALEAANGDAEIAASFLL